MNSSAAPSSAESLATRLARTNRRKSRRERPQSNRTYRSGIPSTSQGAQTQTALNYFGYNAGRVDGQVGRGTRSAIERYQASMGYPVNGYDFQPYQSDFLMQAYYWATSGGQSATQLSGPTAVDGVSPSGAHGLCSGCCPSGPGTSRAGTTCPGYDTRRNPNPRRLKLRLQTCRACFQAVPEARRWPIAAAESCCKTIDQWRLYNPVEHVRSRLCAQRAVLPCPQLRDGTRVKI